MARGLKFGGWEGTSHLIPGKFPDSKKVRKLGLQGLKINFAPISLKIYIWDSHSTKKKDLWSISTRVLKLGL